MFSGQSRSASAGTPPRRGLRLTSFAAACLGLVASAAAQAPSSAPENPARPSVSQPAADAPIPPALRLGARVQGISRAQRIVPTLVIVPDEASYVAALEVWSTGPNGGLRFPVLIDDGTWAARIRIARFVRGFRPATVLRWQARGDKAKLPVDPAALQARLQSVVNTAWGVDASSGTSPADLTKDLAKHWQSVGLTPPGVIAASPKDPTWTAAIALSAFRGQPIVWVDSGISADPAGYIGPDTAERLNRQIVEGLKAMPWTFDAVGDDIESITLCLNVAERVFLGQNNKAVYLALSDMLGRTNEAAGYKRWAWAGHILGNAGSSAYDAMSALFLAPANAYLADGYADQPPFSDYDLTKTATDLEKGGIRTIVDDRASGIGLSELRLRSAGTRAGTTVKVAAAALTEGAMGIDAGLIFVNTSGNPEFFDLTPGQGKPADVPILRRPGLVYFVHSFSAASATSPDTVGGRFRQRGSYAYVGSVHEPFLQGFVPPQRVVRRLQVGMPLAAAVRPDDGAPWKIAVLGDPLIMLSPPSQRIDQSAVELPGAQRVEDELPLQLKSRSMAAALWSLAYLGREVDASRLLAAIERDDPAGFTPDVALAGLSSAFFVGEYPTFLKAVNGVLPLLDDERRVTREGLADIRDMFWQAIFPTMGRPTPQEAALFAPMLRKDMLQRDLADALPGMIYLKGESGADTLRQAAARLSSKP